MVRELVSSSGGNNSMTRLNVMTRAGAAPVRGQGLPFTLWSAWFCWVPMYCHWSRDLLVGWIHKLELGQGKIRGFWVGLTIMSVLRAVVVLLLSHIGLLLWLNELISDLLYILLAVNHTAEATSWISRLVFPVITHILIWGTRVPLVENGIRKVFFFFLFLAVPLPYRSSPARDRTHTTTVTTPNP